MRFRTIDAAAGLVAALAVFAMLTLVLLRGINLPFWDEWAWVPLIAAAHQHTLTFADLWQPHNEHRIFVPNLLMLLLDRLGGWNVVREQVLSVAMLAATQLVVWLLIRRTVKVGAQGLTFLAATVLLFGIAQYENLEWGFQMAWFLCNLGMIVAVWALALPGRGTRELAIAIASALVASLSSSQGLASWVAGAVVIFLVPKRSARLVVVWFLAAIIATGLARFGVPSASASGWAQDTPALHLARYLLAYLGAPLAGSFGPRYSAVAGAALIAWLAALAVAAWRAQAPMRTLLAPWFAIAAYVLVCALLIAVGRGGSDVAQAMSSRYTSIGTLAWLSVMVATMVSGYRIRRGALILGIASALVVCLSFTQDVYGNARWVQHTNELRVARERLSRADIQGIAAVYPDPVEFMIQLGELYDIRDGAISARSR